MKRLLFFFVVVLLLAAPAMAKSGVQQVQYAINVSQDQAHINTSIAVSCDAYCSGIEWQLPEDGEVILVKNSRGPVDYTVNGNTVS
ncbi:MAG: hypothetical protein ABEJ72_04855, partial [Candidatus Aenigmatarchaeota archaeon]